MINFPRFQKQVVRTLSSNSPVILAGASIIGVIGTSVVSVRAGMKAVRKIDNLKAEQFEKSRGEVDAEGIKLPLKETFLHTWTCYIPVVTVGALTITSMILSSKISSKRAAAMATAYSLTNVALKDQISLTEALKNKMKERLGEEETEKVEKEVAEERASEHQGPIIVMGNGEVLMHDTLTGRYFMSSVVTIEKARNTVNGIILDEMYASLNDFFSEIGLPRTNYGDEVGWNLDRKLEISFGSKVSEDGRPCVTIIYATDPIREYHKVF